MKRCLKAALDVGSQQENEGISPAMQMNAKRKSRIYVYVYTHVSCACINFHLLIQVYSLFDSKIKVML